MRLVIENERFDGEPLVEIRGVDHGPLSARFVGTVPALGEGELELPSPAYTLKELVLRLLTFFPINLTMKDRDGNVLHEMTIITGDALVPLPMKTATISVANTDIYPAVIKAYII